MHLHVVKMLRDGTGMICMMYHYDVKFDRKPIFSRSIPRIPND